MNWKYIHKGYYIAKSELTNESYVVRMRPKNDGWMAICDSDGIVIDTGLSFAAAKQAGEDQDTYIAHTFNL